MKKELFRYLTNDELNTDDIYVRYDSNVLSMVKLVSYNNFLWTTGLGIKATTTLLCPLKELIGCKVKYYNFTGVLSPIALPYTSKDSKFDFQYECFVTWDNGQRQIPSGWVKMSKLKFL